MVMDRYRESTVNWEEVLLDLNQRWLAKVPQLGVGDDALGFWNALDKVWPSTSQQRCWVCNTANVLDKLTK